MICSHFLEVQKYNHSSNIRLKYTFDPAADLVYLLEIRASSKYTCIQDGIQQNCFDNWKNLILTCVVLIDSFIGDCPFYCILYDVSQISVASCRSYTDLTNIQCKTRVVFLEHIQWLHFSKSIHLRRCQ